MTTPDRSAFLAALALWLMAAVGAFLLGTEVTSDVPKRWLGHWITLVWAFTGWIPALILARKPKGSGR